MDADLHKTVFHWDMHPVFPTIHTDFTQFTRIFYNLVTKLILSQSNEHIPGVYDYGLYSLNTLLLY